MPSVVIGTTAQFLFFETAKTQPQQAVLPALEGKFDEKYGNSWLREIQARPVSAREVNIK